MTEGTNRYLIVNRPVKQSALGFDEVVLYHDRDTRKLCRLLLSRSIDPKMERTEFLHLVKEIVADVDYRLALKMSVKGVGDFCDDLGRTPSSKEHDLWETSASDLGFEAALRVRKEKQCMKVELVVTSKKVLDRRPRMPEPKEIEVDVTLISLCPNRQH